jgi:hypothetical protein
MDITTRDNTLLLNKLRAKFTDTEQLLFVESFRLYLEHDQEKDFIVNLDDIWKWMGFSTKGNAKRLLFQKFIKDKDYKSEEETAYPHGEAVSLEETRNGGQNKETILLTVNTFKKLCLKADTKKADEIHDYYIKMENVLQEVIQETFIEEQKELINITKSNVLMDEYNNKDVLYLAWIELNLLKYGITQDIKTTLSRHQDTYGKQVYFTYILECKDRDKLEKKIKTHNDLLSRHVKIYDNQPRRELIRLDTNFTIKDFIKLIESLNGSMIIRQSTKLELAKELTKQKEIDLEMKKLELEILKFNNTRLHVDNESINIQNSLPEHNENTDIIPLPEDTIESTNNNTNTINIFEQSNTQNIYEEFLNEKTVYSRNLKDKISMTQLQDMFTEWMISKNIFTERLLPQHIKSIRNIKYQTGVNINNMKTSGICYRKIA